MFLSVGSIKATTLLLNNLFPRREYGRYRNLTQYLSLSNSFNTTIPAPSCSQENTPENLSVSVSRGPRPSSLRRSLAFESPANLSCRQRSRGASGHHATAGQYERSSRSALSKGPFASISFGGRRVALKYLGSQIARRRIAVRVRVSICVCVRNAKGASNGYEHTMSIRCNGTQIRI